MRFLLSGLLLFLISCSNRQAEKTGHEGELIPNFTLLLTDQSTYFNTQEIPAKKPTVLFNFGPHCPYSMKQMQEIIYNMEHLRNIQFYIFTNATFQEMKDFSNKFHLEKYDNVTIGCDSANFFGQYFNVKGYPYLSIYGKDKKLNNAFIGHMTANEIIRIAEKN